MASIINNCKIQYPKCTIHNDPSGYIYMQQKNIKLICSKCLPFYPMPSIQSPLKIIGFQKLKDYINSIIIKQEVKLKKIPSVNIRQVIQNKKKQVQQKQYRILQQIIKIISDQKKKLFFELDFLQKHYAQQQFHLRSFVEQTDNIIKYFKQFCLDQKLLKLKIMSSSQYGLNSFFSQIRTLQGNSGDSVRKNTNNLLASVTKEIKQKQYALFLNKIQSILQNLKEPCAPTPLKLQFMSPKNQSNQQIMTQRRNQSHQHFPLNSPRTSRQQSFAQLPKIPFN